jgi:PRTRC genetic system ThiF family protein
MPKPLMHRIKHWMLHDRITIVVVGCGGTGAALVSGLPYLHHALLAAGHPSGITVCVIDGDRITETNCVRQPFTLSEAGLYKAQVLVNRLNVFWGLDWCAIPTHVRCGRDVPDCDFLISCVDRVNPLPVDRDVWARLRAAAMNGKSGRQSVMMRNKRPAPVADRH